MQCQPVIPVEWSPEQEQRGIYRQLLFRRRAGLTLGQSLPRIECQARGIIVSANKLAAYRRVCGGSSDESVVPLLYPHTLLGSAHLLMLSHKAFPLGSVGMLHLRNHVVRYRPFRIDESWDMTCRIARQWTVEKGLEFDFDSTVSIGQQIVWRSVSTFLKHGSPLGQVEESVLADLFVSLCDESTDSKTYKVPSNIGKQYARITGDYNPIHVSHLAAKLFGFKRTIAHGMWSVARVLNDLPDIDDPVRLDVAFKGPMFVSSNMSLKRGGKSHRFDVFCNNNPRPVIVGLYRPTDSDDRLL